MYGCLSFPNMSSVFEVSIVFPRYITATLLLKYLFHSEGVKRTWFSTPELDELLDKKTTTVDPEERQQYIDVVCKYLIDNCPWIPLYAPKSALAWKAIYTGIIINMYEGGTILWEDIAMGRGG